MCVKNSIRFLEYSSIIAVTGFLLMVLACVGGAQAGGNINFIAFILSVVIILVFVFKNSIIRYQMEHSKHKNLFYYIIDRMQLDEKFSLTNERTQNIQLNYHDFSANDFIRDNGLKTQIGIKRNRTWNILFTYTIFLIVMFFVNKIFNLSINDSTLLIVLGAIIIGYYFLFNDIKGRRFEEEPLISFDAYCLNIFNKKISWKNIVDWKYNAGGRDKSSSVKVYYQNAHLEVKAINIELKRINISKIDLVLLLTVFKEKYGQSVY